MDSANWAEFPYSNKRFSYPGARLTAAWSELHRGDAEPLPTDERLLDAWRHYHAGEFSQAVELAEHIGLSAHVVANKASGIYADYLEEDEQIKQAIYQSGIKRAAEAIKKYPDDANGHYFHAFLLGRYSQSISIGQALAQGIGGKVKQSLERAIELAPQHAEAHTAMGLYQSEIINKVGRLVASLTYGASIESAMQHFEEALGLTPEAPIAHIEYGNGLYLLFGDKRLDESNAAYAAAARIKPIEAMQKLDVEFAKASL